MIYGAESGVHVSGHASQEELKLLFNLVRPKYLSRSMANTGIWSITY